jgi:amino acid adenylation domain-containing protein
MLVERLEPERAMSHSPMFQVMFMMMNVGGEGLRLPGLTLRSMEVEGNTSKFDLSLSIAEETDSLNMSIEYSVDLFDASTIIRMFGHYERLLEAIIEDPDRPVTELPLLTRAELSQLLFEWNDSRAEFPVHLCFHQLFEAQAERNADVIAIECEGQSLSYDQLNRRANRLARLLVQHGVGPDVLVALLADRGIEMLISILAIFKAGGAYVPLDPNHPAKRLSQVIAQSRSRLILAAADLLATASQAIENIESPAPPAVLVMEELLQREAPEENLPLRSSPRSLAYVIYTSGSTGAPKGAMIEQAGMVNHLCAKVKGLELTSADRVAENASQCFDVSVWQFLAVLLAGGQTVVFTDETAHDPGRSLNEIEHKAISVIETVPSFLKSMVDEAAALGDNKPRLASLRWLISNGEALPSELCQQWFNAYPDIALINAYGPTECSDDVTHYAIYRPPSETAKHMPLGRPLHNMRLYVLDKK